MATFMSNFFPAVGKEKSTEEEAAARPSTPNKQNSFINPTHTPQGSPSKKSAPPGAFDLPTAFDNAISLGLPALESAHKPNRPQSVISPLSPTQSNQQPLDEPGANIDESIIHNQNIKTQTGSSFKIQGQENTPPVGRPAGSEQHVQHSHAALSRQQQYEPRERPTTPAAKRFNTSRGLTAEEREILQKPAVKRLVNVTQLCM